MFVVESTGRDGDATAAGSSGRGPRYRCVEEKDRFLTSGSRGRRLANTRSVLPGDQNMAELTSRSAYLEMPSSIRGRESATQDRPNQIQA